MPPLSLDLASMDFSYDRVLKNKFYEKNIHTVGELKEYITKVFIKIDAD